MPILSRQPIRKEPGYMYFVQNEQVWASPLKNNKTGKRHLASNERIAGSAGKMCWINKQGYVETK